MTLNLIGVVAPITAVVAAALPTLVGVLGGERLHLGQVGGIAVGLAAIVLINGPSREVAKGARVALGLALVAGLAFGLFFILFHAASSAGVVAFLSGRVGSALAAMGFALVSGVSFVPRRTTWRLIGVGGALDGIGVVLYLFATFHGLLSLSALLTSFYPGFTIRSVADLSTATRLSDATPVVRPYTGASLTKARSITARDRFIPLTASNQVAPGRRDERPT